MESLPHVYSAGAFAELTGNVVLSSPGVPSLHSAPPTQFDGPGDQWSPETLLVAAVADCFILTFRAVARASHVPWTALRCHGEGRLERSEGTTRFTDLALRAHLTVPIGTDVEKARRALEKAKAGCLVSNSLALTPTLTCEIEAMPEESREPDLFPKNISAEFAREWR